MIPEPAPFGFVYPEDAAADDSQELEEHRGEQERAAGEAQMAVEPNAEQGSVAPESSQIDDDHEGQRRDPQPVVESVPTHSIVQDTGMPEEPLSSSLSRVPGAESGEGKMAGGIEAGFKAEAGDLAAAVTAPPGVSRSKPSAPTDPPTARDADALKAIARLRVLSYEQLRVRFFPGHGSLVARRMQKLELAGWVVRYRDRLTEGGHPSYVFPTAKTMRWARTQFQAGAEGQPYAQLVGTMMPNIHAGMYTSNEQPIPDFLPHQERTNELAQALEGTPALGVQWMSTWPRPFPHAYANLQLPQPDLVFVARINGLPQLFFGELDNHGNESLAHFKDHKADRALALQYSGVLADLTGFAQFQMLVVVSDAPDPIDRVRKLMEVTTASYAGSLFAFTLAPWLLSDPSGPIWFPGGLPPEHPSLLPTEHHGLKRLDQLASPDAGPLGSILL